MIVIGGRIIRNFIEQHPDAESQLKVWQKVASKTGWKNIVEVRQTYPHADAVGACTVFNIKGNRYRLVTIIDYRAGYTYQRHFNSCRIR
jgi:mRNA interferase HigB